jgi:hypothetical protein
MTGMVGVLGTDVGSTSTVTFSGSTTSSAVDLNNKSIVSITIPSSMAGTTIKFSTCDTSGGTFTTLRDGSAGTDVSFTITSTAGTYTAGSLLASLAGLQRYVKLVSSASETATVVINTRVV